jgi:hypothetical protein
MGRINPWWLGWGEESMLAGEEIERRCLDPEHTSVSVPPGCDKFNLYDGYPGFWLDAPPRVRQTVMLDSIWQLIQRASPAYHFSDRQEFQYTDHDYYVLNRSSIVQANWEFPTKVPPEFAIEFRGYAEAWVFRGDRLLAANVRFPPKNP